MFSTEMVLRKLKENNLKLTPQRIETIYVLAKIGHKHPSLKEILTEVAKKVPTISFSTLYTIIKTLEDLNLIKTFDINGETRVEINIKPHVNFIFNETGEIRDIEDPELLEHLKKEVKNKLGSKVNYEISLVNVYLERTYGNTSRD